MEHLADEPGSPAPSEGATVLLGILEVPSIVGILGIRGIVGA